MGFWAIWSLNYEETPGAFPAQGEREGDRDDENTSFSVRPTDQNPPYSTTSTMYIRSDKHIRTMLPLRWARSHYAVLMSEGNGQNITNLLYSQSHTIQQKATKNSIDRYLKGLYSFIYGTSTAQVECF